MNAKMLKWRKESHPGQFETIEGIDTLRFIEYGKYLQFCPVEIEESLSVDTPKDLERIKQIISKRGATI